MRKFEIARLHRDRVDGSTRYREVEDGAEGRSQLLPVRTPICRGEERVCAARCPRQGQSRATSRRSACGRSSSRSGSVRTGRHVPAPVSCLGDGAVRLQRPNRDPATRSSQKWRGRRCDRNRRGRRARCRCRSCARRAEAGRLQAAVDAVDERGRTGRRDMQVARCTTATPGRPVSLREPAVCARVGARAAADYV